MRLENWRDLVRNVMVTGGSRGLGLALVEKLLQQGYGVVAISRQSSPELDVLLENAQQASCFLPYDFADCREVEGLVRLATNKVGAIYGLVNNAAMGLSGLLATEKVNRIEAAITLNLTAPILLTRAVVRTMLAAGRGRIVNISSINAITGYKGLSVYAASKAGLIGFSKSLARELGSAGITVNVVAPGFLETEMSADISDDRRSKILRRSPLKRFATCDEVADAIAYLLSDGAAAMTGSMMTVDAGNSA